MSSYKYEEYVPPHNRSGLLWTILSALTILSLICVAWVTLLIYADPNSALNPFPPPTMPPLMQLPTATPTDVVYVLPATWTATFTIEPSATLTPSPTSTLPPTPTPITITPSPTIQLPPPTGGYPFQIRQGNPKAIPNIYHPELGCNWMGVGGQVIDLSNAPVIGLIIKLGGQLPGVSFPEDQISLTGVALSYGRSGYEFTLANKPKASQGQVWVQLISQAGGPLSEKIVFDTYDSCEQNLTIIDFVQVRK
jgi:hypothetical protein